MAYEKQTWTDGTEEDPGKGTRINAERMEHIEDGIYNADQESSSGISDLQDAIDDLKKTNEDQDSEISSICDDIADITDEEIEALFEDDEIDATSNPSLIER